VGEISPERAETIQQEEAQTHAITQLSATYSVDILCGDSLNNFGRLGVNVLQQNLCPSFSRLSSVKAWIALLAVDQYTP